MDDLIKRQDAIRVVREYMIDNQITDGDYHADGIERELHELPSVELEIIRCSQCRFAEVADKEDEQDGYTCQFHRGSIWFSGSYCSWAERRTDG